MGIRSAVNASESHINLMQRIHVFIDESGDEHLHVDRGASRTYVLAAVCVQEKDLQAFVEAADLVRRSYFQAGEIKSSKVADNLKRRRVVLEKLCGLNFWGLSYIVSKEHVERESGLRFASSFLKYTARKLCGHLPMVDEVCVWFDEKGRVKFKKDFARYLSDNFNRPDLFRTIRFDHLNSRESVAIQVADFLAGSVAKWHTNRPEARDLGIDSLLRKKASVLEWPTLRSEGALPESEQERFDETVARESFARVHSYQEANSASDEDDVRLRCMFLDWLLSHALFGSGGFLHGDGVINKANMEMGLELSPQALRSRVIGPLRDIGLLIASSATGYKIPDCLDDLMKYVDICATQIPPAVSRLKRARDVMLLATGGELDLLGADQFGRLRGIVESG